MWGRAPAFCWNFLLILTTPKVAAAVARNDYDAVRSFLHTQQFMHKINAPFLHIFEGVCANANAEMPEMHVGLIY